MNNPKKSFILHIDSLCVLDEMSFEQKGILFDAIYKYQLGEEIDLDFSMKMAFAPFKNQFIRDNEKYLQFIEKQSNNGKKGGRPIESQDNPNNPSLSKEPKPTLNDNDSDNDSNKDNKDNTTDGSGISDKSLNLLEFVTKFNDVRKSKFSHKNEKLANQLNARLKEGFTIDQIVSATKNAMREKYHIENRYRHLTPEFMLRQDKLEKYLDITSAPNEKPIELYDGKEIHESNGRRFVFYGETIKYIYPPVPDTTGWTDEEKYNYFTCDRFNDTWAEKYKNARDNQMNTTEAEKRGIYKYFYDQETLRFKIADHRNVRTS